LTAVVAISIGAIAVAMVALLVRERKARKRFRMLADIAAVSDSGGSLEHTFESICDILVPDLADFCLIDVFSEGHVRRAAVRVAPGAEEGIGRRLAERRPSTPEHMLAENGSASLKPRFFERMPDSLLRELADDPEDFELLRRIAPRSAITVALNARGKVTGTLTIGVAWSKRRYHREDAAFAWILSGRVALALDNAGLFDDLERAERERAEIAETLQRGLLPPPLPNIPGWSVAAMYRPAGAQNEVGGDFYDVYRVPGGWMLAIGDVTGRGAQAASVTAVARYTLRTAAMLSNDPLIALSTLNRALLARGDGALCSLVAIVLSEDPVQPVRLAVAGHPPPLLVDGEQVAEAAEAKPVLGAFPDARWSLVKGEVEFGQQLVIATDGVSEAQGDGGRFGERRLTEELRGATKPALALERLEAALHGFTAGDLDDDIAILALSRAGNEPEPALSKGAGTELVERLFDCFNRRDEECIEAVCDEEMAFFPIVTAEAVGREAPYVGPAGLRDYMGDIEEVWEELQIAPGTQEWRGSKVLVRGRVYARSRELGIRDLPVAWIWEVRDGLFVRGEVYPDPEEAAARFDAVSV
jgi:serine phosphatase RsbU (regulator of sigma subunit)/ketosteroid isomerase-like protein